MSNINDRLRSIIHGTRPPAVPVVAPEASTAPAVRRGGSLDPPARARAAAVLGGRVLDRADGAVIVVDREYRADDLHGHQRIGDLVDTIREGRDDLAMLARAWPTSALRATADKPTSAQDPPLFFLDLETTGLFGGAGTQAFLVGCAAIVGDGIHVRQYLLPGFEHEPAVLREVSAWMAAHGAVVTYNGKSFDVPLIETRFLFHRVPFPLAGVPHLDMLHAARRLWRERPAAAGHAPDEGSCSLTVLEKHLAGLHRVGDVPGFEIPSRYFQFVRDGDARPLEAVLEHNRLDLISLAAVMARAVTLLARGPSATATPQECFGLARLYERAGAMEDAEAALGHSIDLARRVGTEPDVHAEALRRLAWVRRRLGRLHAAAEAWNGLADLPRCPAAFRREAREALAIYHEHRSRDLGAARALVLDVLKDDPLGRRKEAAEHRLRRLERKIAVREQGGLVAALDASLDVVN